MKNIPAPSAIRITAAAPTTSAIFPEDPFDTDSEVVWENLPRTSLELEGFRAVAGVPSHVAESEVSSVTGADVPGGE
jgi:hypothetical protein